MLILPYVEEANVSENALQTWEDMKKAPPGQDAYNSKMDPINKLLLPMYLCPSDEGLKYQREKYGTADRKAMSYCGVAGSYFARTGDCVTAAVNGRWKQPGRYCISADMAFLGPVNFDGLLIQGSPIATKQVSDGLSKTLLIGERTYQIRTWMIGAFAKASPGDPPSNPRGAPLPPDGPQPIAPSSLRKTSPISGRSITIPLSLVMSITKMHSGIDLKFLTARRAKSRRTICHSEACTKAARTSVSAMALSVS